MGPVSVPQLRVLPNPTAELMERLGQTTIAELLGTYASNLEERDRLFNQLLPDLDGGLELDTDQDRALFARWLATDRRLHLWRLLLNELDQVS